jgi:hypothetical protein
MPSKLCVALLAVLTASACAAADSSLLDLAMPDSAVLIGIRLDRIRADGARYEQVMTPEAKEQFDKGVAQVTQMLGYNLSDLLEIVIALRPAAAEGSGKGLVLFRGPFNAEEPPGVLAMLPTERSDYNGVPLLLTKPGKGDPIAIAFLDGSALVVGDPASVRGAIDRKKAGGGAPSPLAAKAAELSRTYHIWCVGRDLKSALPPGVGLPPNAAAVEDLSGAIEEVTAGAILAPGVSASLDVVARTPEDAAAIRDKLAAGIEEGLKKTTPDQAAQLKGAVHVEAQDKHVKLSFEIPEAQVLELIKAKMKEVAPAQPPPNTEVTIHQ